jgi:hypothetical protein
MVIGLKAAAAVVALAIVVGFLIAKRHDVFHPGKDRGPAAFAAVPEAPSGRHVRSLVRARELRILGVDESVGVWLRAASEGSPEIWMANVRKTAIIEAGVHGNGFPFLLVSDGAVRNFGLGRVDGLQASPILVFRADDVVRMVFGLGMTEPSTPPFLVHYTADGRKHDVVGRYCDRSDRVCVR